MRQGIERKREIKIEIDDEDKAMSECEVEDPSRNSIKKCQLYKNSRRLVHHLEIQSHNFGEKKTVKDLKQVQIRAI